ncbi:enoyl-CoA hydratase/isomerase family protein [Kiloniella sp. b19]|uniref:enoyl-CoA hydratase/isomerase family protein n=1 Tax=Kiloniella sp. GXU_MW_B19 TaxID=3141326 RepID=UPI0031D2FF65
MTQTIEEDILFSEENGVGVVVLNRPRALNALTHHMIAALYERLLEWHDNEAIDVVLIKSSSERAFCAGGDVRAVWDDADRGEGLFRVEYRLNNFLAHFRKPYVSLLDGYVMGGGVGTSIYGSHRIVTERSVFAMPEIAIGLHPDVGGGYFLNQMPGRLGWFLGLTGYRCSYLEGLFCGFGTHLLDASDLKVFEERLVAASDKGFARVDSVLKSLARDCSAADTFLARNQKVLDQALDHKTLGEAVDELLKLQETVDGQDGEILGKALKAMGKGSKRSLLLTWENLRQSRGQAIGQVLERELRISTASVYTSDFKEGIRSVLVDKDGNPDWEDLDLHNPPSDFMDYYDNWTLKDGALLK